MLMDIPITQLEQQLQNTNATSHQVIQDAKFLERGNLAEHLKIQALRFIVQKNVSKNEQQGILTGVHLVDLNKDKTLYGHNLDTEHFAASVNKLPVTMLLQEELRAGTVSLDDVVELPPADQRIGGAGRFDAGDDTPEATIGEILEDMLKQSGNTAVRVLVTQLGGPELVNDRLEQDPNLAHTYLIELGEGRFWLGNTTPRESMYVMEKVVTGEDEYASFVKTALENNVFSDYGVKSQRGDSDYIVLANKMGQLDDPDGNNRHDVGIIYNTRTGEKYGFSIMTTSPYEQPELRFRGEESIENIGYTMLRFAGDRGEIRIPFSLKMNTEAVREKITF